MIANALYKNKLDTPLPQVRKIESRGLWFAFLFTVYIILLIKVSTGSYWNDNIFFRFYSVTITAYILSRFILSYIHKKIEFDPKYEPTITFVVPAKNEEDNIAETIGRFGEIDYPKEKIEVIAINDGSTDRTYDAMLRAAGKIYDRVGRVEIVNWTENRGKRAGMAEGVKRATHDIIIFIDSDSFVEPDCPRQLVKYFSNDKIGAVSGHTDVYNKNTNVLTRMQAMRYYIAFKVYKAAESVFGVVTCCPGCCSAYRKKYLMEFIDDWLHQKFLGKDCTFGDDRSLTNFILKKYMAAYSIDAKAYTVVPDTFSKYVKQQQRWKKSWIRETFIASSFIWKKSPLAAIFFYSYLFLALAGPFVFLHAMFWSPIISRTIPIVYLNGLFLMLLLHGIYYRIHTGKQPWLLTVVSFWFYSVILMWQLPWAAITIADTRWGTR